MIWTTPENKLNLNEDCLRGLHPLKEIYRNSNGFIDEVVRWCPDCGAIVIDSDCDGRTYPGRQMPMRLAKLYETVRKELGLNK